VLGASQYPGAGAPGAGALPVLASAGPAGALEKQEIPSTA